MPSCDSLCSDTIPITIRPVGEAYRQFGHPAPLTIRSVIMVMSPPTPDTGAQLSIIPLDLYDKLGIGDPFDVEEDCSAANYGDMEIIGE